MQSENGGQANEQRLSELKPGEAGVIVRLDIEGAGRWRLMDLGILPGTHIVAEMSSPLGDPLAYRVRGSLIALRHDQADSITVKRI